MMRISLLLPAWNKAKHISLASHFTKTVHHHHHPDYHLCILNYHTELLYWITLTTKHSSLIILVAWVVLQVSNCRKILTWDSIKTLDPGLRSFARDKMISLSISPTSPFRILQQILESCCVDYLWALLPRKYLRVQSQQ